VLTIVRWRLDIVRDLLLAAAVAALLAVAIDELWLGGTTDGVWHALWSVDPPARARKPLLDHPP